MKKRRKRTHIRRDLSEPLVGLFIKVDLAGITQVLRRLLPVPQQAMCAASELVCRSTVGVDHQCASTVADTSIRLTDLQIALASLRIQQSRPCNKSAYTDIRKPTNSFKPTQIKYTTFWKNNLFIYFQNNQTGFQSGFFQNFKYIYIYTFVCECIYMN